MSDNPVSSSPPRVSSAQVYAQRRRRLRQAFGKPCALAAGLSRVRNFAHNRYPFRAESHFLYLIGHSLEGALLVMTDTTETLYVDPPDPLASMWTGPEPTLEELEAQLGIPTRPLATLELGEAFATLPPQDTDSADLLSELLGRDVEAGSGPSLEGADLELADAMISLRLLHDDAAIDQLRQAATTAVRAHLAGIEATCAGKREFEVAAAMLEVILRAGMTVSYNPIVTLRGEVLHNSRQDGLLSEGDLLLADVGAETAEGWASDITRTWPVSKHFSATQRAIYQAVLSAQEAAIACVKPGIRFSEVHHAAGRNLLQSLIDLGIFRGDRDDLYERGAAAVFFPHGVGHLLGLDVHDMEDLGDRAGYGPGRARGTARSERFLRLDRILCPNMVVTIEPGFYQIDPMLSDPEEVGDLESALDRSELSHFSDVRGIRIEDDVLVTSDGAEVLTRELPKSLDDIERLRAG